MYYRSFDARKINPDSRRAVEQLLTKRGESFDPKVAKRASIAAAPLAAWVKANVSYAAVLERIAPLEEEQSTLRKYNIFNQYSLFVKTDIYPPIRAMNLLVIATKQNRL